MSIATGFLIFGKFLGFFGVMLGFLAPFRVLAGLMLTAAGVCIVACIVLAIIEGRKQTQNDDLVT